jgi:flagellar basal-body rod protein FlgB
MLDRMTDAIDFHGKALQLRAQRQEVLSSNIANADTPGFKARDFDFAAALRNAAGPASAGVPGTALGSDGGFAADGAGGGRVVSTLTGAVAHAAPALSRSQPGHLAPGHSGATLAGRAVEHSTRLQYTVPEQASLDGNSVDLNRERANFADNSLRYEATLRFINGRVRTMITAIRGE